MRQPQVRYKSGSWRGIIYHPSYHNGELRYREEWITLRDPYGERITDAAATLRAKRALRQHLKSRRTRSVEHSEDMTLGEAVTAFLAARQHTMAHSSLITYKASLGRARELMGHYVVSAIGPAEIERYQASLLALGVTAQTASNYVNILSSMFRWLADAGILPEGRNPAERIRRPRIPEKERPFLSWAEAPRLLNAIEHPPYRAAAAAGIYAGLRRGEVLMMRWDNVDFDRGIIHVTNTGEWSTKSGRNRQTILLPEMAEVLAEVPRVGEWIVTHTRTVRGLRSGREALGRAFRRARKEAGYPHLRFHDLRGSFCTELLQRFPPAVVQQVMGHTDLKTTMKYYNRIDPYRAVEIIRKGMGNGEDVP